MNILSCYLKFEITFYFSEKFSFCLSGKFSSNAEFSRIQKQWRSLIKKFWKKISVKTLPNYIFLPSLTLKNHSCIRIRAPIVGWVKTDLRKGTRLIWYLFPHYFSQFFNHCLLKFFSNGTVLEELGTSFIILLTFLS